jgi:hypothetical protein
MPTAVVVACKLPAGLLLRLHEVRKEAELVMGGGTREVLIARAVGEPVRINGTAAPFGHQRRDSAGEFVSMSGGYALTFGVDKDFWDKWLAQNAELDAVRNKLLFAHEKPVEVQAIAKDRVSLKTGLEPLTPTLADGGGRVYQTDPRAPRSIVKSEDAAKAA